jgi:hypothetical protein
LQRIALDKQLRLRQWQSLGKSDRAKTTPDQIILTPGERMALVQKLFNEAQAAGKITPALIAANTNLSVAVAQIIARKLTPKKGAELLTKAAQTGASNSSGSAAVSAQSTLPPVADPLETLLSATFPISDDDLAALATERAKAVRTYILQTGQVEDTRLFLTETQAGGVRSDGSRVYLQFQ